MYKEDLYKEGEKRPVMQSAEKAWNGGYKKMWEEARQPPRKPLTVRRKFIILLTRSQLNDIPPGSSAWARQLYKLVSQHDHDVTHDDIKRWIKHHNWITNAASERIPGMQSLWNCATNRVTKLGKMSHSFPREILNTQALSNVGNNEGSQNTSTSDVELNIEGRRRRYSQRIDTNVDSMHRVIVRNVYYRNKSQPPVLTPYFNQPIVQYDNDAEAPLNLIMYPPSDHEMEASLQLGGNEHRRQEQQDRIPGHHEQGDEEQGQEKERQEQGQQEQGRQEQERQEQEQQEQGRQEQERQEQERQEQGEQEQGQQEQVQHEQGQYEETQELTQPVDMTMNVDQQPNIINNNESLPSQPDSPQSSVFSVPLPEGSSTLYRLEEIFESVLALAKICNALSDIHDKTRSTLHHMYKVVARKHAREVIIAPYEVLHAREQKRIKEEVVEVASKKEDKLDLTPLRGLCRYNSQGAKLVVVNLESPPRRPTPGRSIIFLTPEPGEHTPAVVLQDD